MDIDKYYEYKNTSFRERIFKDKFPLKYRCSCCGDGVLKFKSGTFFSTETVESRNAQSHDEWEPDWISYVFSGGLICQSCGSPFYVSGTGTVEEQWDDVEGQIHYDVFYPLFFVPTIHLFNIPINTPAQVKKIIESAFSLAWADYSASGNKLRVALEIIIDGLIPKSKDSLGIKINSLPEKMADIKAKLNAIKWLGNEGSHVANLEECDLAFAFKVIEKVLLTLYPSEDDTEKLMEQVHLINKNKGSIVQKTVI